MSEASAVVSQPEEELEFRTCLECLQNKMCHPMLAICKECFLAVWVPALPDVKVKIKEKPP